MSELGVVVPLGETIRRDAEARAPARRIASEVAEAKAAFERAVVEDWPSAVERYLEWCDTMHRSNEAGAEQFVDVPHFATVVDRVLYVAAAARRRASDTDTGEA